VNLLALLGPLPAYEFNFDAVIKALPLLAQGVMVTVVLTLIVIAFALPLGLGVAFARLVPLAPVRWFAYGYTELFRTTPLLVQIIWFNYVLPITFGIRAETFVLGALALILNVGAFQAEIFRGSILSIDPGQRDAAIATGMTDRMAMRRIVLPQAFVRALPLTAAIFISLFKDTSLVAVIGIQDLMFQAQQTAADTYRPLETLSVAALIYFALTFPQAVVVNRLFERFRVVE
jgi:His/Glu/Gln/Arg/opine family amino acid ABC transporter permease subunit